MGHTKRRQQARTQRRDDPLVTRAVAVLSDIFAARANIVYFRVRLQTEIVPLPPRVKMLAVMRVADQVVGDAIERGWGPTDIAEYVRRGHESGSLDAVLAEFAAHLARYPASGLDPRWVIAAPHDMRGADPDRRLLGLMVIATLPRIHPVLPPPGSAPATRRATTDEKVLRRIRALLAKAEASEFEHEADAFSEKAQALMTEHSVAHAQLASDGAPTPPAARRIWIDNPYVKAKAVLIAQVADANRCKTVVSADLGFVTVFGFDADLDFVDLLSTSLLVQATRAMRQAGSMTTWSGQSRTKSFRQSFLIAYAYRIGERLRESAERVTTAADEARGGALVPVLDARRAEVDDAVATAFPTLGKMNLSVSNGSGYGAGRAAADQAQLNVRRSVTRPS